MIVNRGPAKGCVWPVLAPAEGIVRAGAVLRGDAVRARGCVRSMPVVRFYWDVLCSFAPIIRSCRNVLCSITPAVCRMSAKQDGLRYVPFLFRRGSRSPFVRSRIVGAVIGLSWFTSGLRVFCGDPDGSTRGRGGRRRRGVGVFLRDCIGFVMFSAGSTLGLRAPNLRQRVFDSLDSLHLGRDVGALYAAKPCALYAGAAGNYWPMIIPIASAVMR